MEDWLAKTQNDTRSDFDSECCKKEHFNALMLARNDPPDAQIQLSESRLKVKFIRHRMTDLLNRFDEIAIQDFDAIFADEAQDPQAGSTHQAE